MLTVEFYVPTALEFWVLAFLLYSIELGLRWELSLRLYRRNSQLQAAEDPTATRSSLLLAFLGNITIKGLPTVIPVLILVFLLGQTGMRLAIWGTLVGLIWQSIRCLATVFQFSALALTGGFKPLTSPQDEYDTYT